MTEPTDTEDRPGPPEARRSPLTALVDLLDDDSPRLLAEVRRSILAAGKPARTELRRAAQSPRARLRGRARELLADAHRAGVLRRLARRAARQRQDLESSLFLLAGLAGGPFDARPYRRALDAMAHEVRLRLAHQVEDDGFARGMVLSRYLGEELGFAGSRDDYHHSDNIHLHRAIERKAGMPLTLSAIYLFVARRAGIKAALVPLPGHVLLRVYHGPERSILVDPFQAGQARSKSDCLAYLRECNLVPQPEWFEDADDGLMLLRQVMNLVNSYSMRGFGSRARELQRVAGVLARVQSRRRKVRLRD